MNIRFNFSNLFINFGAKFKPLIPTTHRHSDIGTLPDLPCAYCGHPMLMKEDVERIKKEIEIPQQHPPMYKSAKIFADTFLRYGESLDPVSLKLLNLIKMEAEQHPRRKLPRLLNSQRVIQEITQERNTELTNVNNFFTAFDSAAKAQRALGLTGVSKLIMDATRSETARILRDKRFSPEMKKAMLGDLYAKLPTDGQAGDFRRRVTEALANLSLSERLPEGILLKSDDPRREEKIVDYIVHRNSRSFEHIRRVGEGGHRTVDNGLAVCIHCNSARGDLPLPQFISVYPSARESIKKQYDFVVGQIQENHLTDRYNSYPVSMSRRLQGYGIEVGSLEQKKEAGESVLESLDARLAKTKEKIAEANTRLGELLDLRKKKKAELEAFVQANPDSFAEIAKRQAECKGISKEINEVHRLLAKLKAQKQQNRAKARTAKKDFGK